MKTNFLKRLVVAALLGLAVTSVRADRESDLIAILQSDASVSNKCAACTGLRRIATPKSLPALLGLMKDERTAHAARYVLEGMPSPEAVAALRQAMTAAQGSTKAGLIDSLGWRHDEVSVELIAPLLSDSNAMIASASASALGQIADSKAAAALSAARDSAPPAVQPAVLDGLLAAAAGLAAHGETETALGIYHGLFSAKYPNRIRIPAWQGLALTDVAGREALLTTAFAGKDYPIEVAAQKTVRLLHDAKVAKACLKDWGAYSSASQVAVLDANVQLGIEGLPAARAALQSSHLAVRVAALQALANLNDASFIPAVVTAAATGDPAERDAARETLSRMTGPTIQKVLLDTLAQAQPQEKAVLLRALGERGDPSIAPVLVQNAASESEPTRLAALESLRIIAAPQTAAPLIDLAAKSKSEGDCQPIVEALAGVCQASGGKAELSRAVLEALGRMPAQQRLWLLPMLAELGTPAALEVAQAATREQDPDTVKQAVRVLAQWPTAEPAPRLLELAGIGASSSIQVLALRGCIAVAGQETDLAKRLSLLQQGVAAAKRPDEKRQALGQIGQIPTPDALKYAMSFLSDPNFANEAGLAALGIIETITPKNAELINDTSVKIVTQCKSPAIIKRIFALREKPTAGPFVRDWVLCGPYRVPGATGQKVFELPLGPEQPGTAVEWKHFPQADIINIGALYPKQTDCSAYLKACIMVPDDTVAALLIGSVDSVKVWLNGEIVHANSVTRKIKADQDTVQVLLKTGANELMLKSTRTSVVSLTGGDAGWKVCARFVGIDGKPFHGLRVEVPNIKRSVLPPHGAFKKLQLSDKFYAEGASYGDIGRLNLW